MFLELSFDSRAGDKHVAASKAASSWRYDRQDKQEMSLDELISDFQQSATGRRSKLDGSVSGSDASPLRMASPPKHSKAKESDKKSWSFGGRAREVKRESTKQTSVRPAAKKVQREDSSDDEGAVSPMPRLEQVLRNKPSLLPRRRAPAATTRSMRAPMQWRKPEIKFPVPSSPSLTPPLLSPVTTSSAASSPQSVPEDIYMSVTPEEDSIDALIGKDIRDLNKLISSGRQSRGETTSTAPSPTTNVLRHSPRFGNTESKGSRSSLRVKIPRGKSRSAKPESPPPPPPPEEDDDFEDEDEEDSFAEEIRKLRESRRLNSMSAKGPDKETPHEETKLEESSEICATTTLKVRNASNAINLILLEALKPFEDRRLEEEKAKAMEGENAGGDAAIRNAATAELQSATQTIVSQLDLTFADMAERRKADLKAEADAATAAKEAEKKDKEAADEKKKSEEKDAKEREMEILRLIPMQGRLLTCSADIDGVLEQLEGVETSAQSEPMGSASAIEADIKALRRHTQRKIQEIEARMSVAPLKNEQSSRSDGVSWRAVDWVQDSVEAEQLTPSERSDNLQLENSENADTEVAHAESEGVFEEVLQRQVLEKLDLTMLKLKHVLAIDTKESVEAKEKQQQEKEEQEREQAQQQLEDERKQRELEDAEHARQRVMGLTSVDEVEGWAEEGCELQGDDRSLNRLMTALKNRTNSRSSGSASTYLRELSPNQEEALRQFDRLTSAMTAKEPAGDSDEVIFDRGDHKQEKGFGNRDIRRQQEEPKKLRWIQVASCSSDSDGDSDSTNSGPDSDESSRRRSKQRSNRGDHRVGRSPLFAPIPSPPRRPRHSLSSSDKQRERLQQDDKYSANRKQRDARFSSEMTQCRRKRGASGLQHEVTRTIQALQAERRQKATWIRSRLCSPSTGRGPDY